LLEAQGHRVVAPDLVGMGPSYAAISSASLATWADQIATVIRQQEEPVILVGHSRGGIVISEAAERVPQRITTLVYLTAFLVESGDTLLGASAKVIRQQTPDILVTQDDGTTIVRRDAIGPVFYNTTDPTWVERAENFVTPEPMNVFMTPLGLTEENYGAVKRAYIECAQDNALPLELQRLMQAALPCAPVFTLDADHSPFYSAPDQLVDYLHLISRIHAYHISQSH
jgi:pimeloyl-ACP methyl ester carboxylesterase